MFPQRILRSPGNRARGSFDIFSIFGGSQPPKNPAPGQNPDQAGKPMEGTQATQGTANNGVVPKQEDQTPVSPLDKHAKIWETPDTPKDSEPQGLFANVDPNKVMESARKVDFSKSLTPELLAKIQAGGQEATAALAQSLNSVAQTVYAQSAMATTKIVEQALEKQQAQFNAQLPQMFKSLSANEGLMASNPLLSNPAVQPLVGALREQLIRKNPNATSAEIQQQVGDYFSSLGQVFAPPAPKEKGKANARAEEDWGKFFE